MRIEGEMTIYRAAELKAQLLAAVQPRTDLEVDLSAVTEIDSAGVQVLMLAKRTARDQGGELKLSAHSPAVIEVFELLDLAAHFGDALLVPSA